MATVIECDKCGEQRKDVSMFMHIRAHEFTGIDDINIIPENHMDVCNDCYEKIFEEVLTWR